MARLHRRTVAGTARDWDTLGGPAGGGGGRLAGLWRTSTGSGSAPPAQAHAYRSGQFGADGQLLAAGAVSVVTDRKAGMGLGPAAGSVFSDSPLTCSRGQSRTQTEGPSLRGLGCGLIYSNSFKFAMTILRISQGACGFLQPCNWLRYLHPCPTLCRASLCWAQACHS